MRLRQTGAGRISSKQAGGLHWENWAMIPGECPGLV